MPHEPPEFPVGMPDECLERIIEFIIHYEYELRREQPLTGHRRAQLALVRRMLSDLGVDVYAE
jgi:hypothetical protein